MASLPNNRGNTSKIIDALEETLGAQPQKTSCSFLNELIEAGAFGTAIYETGDTVLHKLIRNDCFDAAIALIRKWNDAAIVEKTDGKFLVKGNYLTYANKKGETPMMLLDAKDQSINNVRRTIFELIEALGLPTVPVRNVPEFIRAGAGLGSKAARKKTRKNRKNTRKNRKNTRKNNMH